MFTMNDKRILIAGVAIGAVLFIGGFLAYPFFTHSSGPSQSEKFGVSGYAVIKAYHSDGTLYATWEGHNSLTDSARSFIADCASGLATSFPFSPPVGCSSWMTAIDLRDSGGSRVGQSTTTNAGLPTGCVPGSFPACTGWKSTATFDFNTYLGGSGNSAGCTTYPCNIGQVLGGSSVQAENWDLINVSPAITVNSGDRLITTITFTIS